MGDPRATEAIVRDISATPEGVGWRWTYLEPTLKFYLHQYDDQSFVMDFSIIKIAFKDTGPVTLSCFINNRLLTTLHCAHPGDYHLEKQVPAEWLRGTTPTIVRAVLDKVWTSSGRWRASGLCAGARGFSRQAAMSGVISPILGALVTVVAAVAFGLLALDKLGIALRRVERYVLAFVLGSACLSLAILILSALHLARKGVFFALATVLVTFAWRLKSIDKPTTSAVPRWLVGLFFVLTVPFAVRYLVFAWAPEVSADGSTYHLGNVFRFWAHHGLTPIRDMYGAFPEGLEMLFLMAFSIGRHSAAALVHLSFLICLPLLIVSYSSRFGFPKAGFLAAVLVFASPLMGKDGSEAYNDVALATVSFGVFYAIELWIEERKGNLLIVAGVFAGFCFDIKYTGFVAGMYALLQIVPRLVREWRFDWRAALLFAAPCVVMVAPWLVKNAVYMHNPLSPFFNSLFPNPYNSPKFEQEYSQAMAAYAGTTDIRDLAFKYTVTGTSVAGFFGPLFLLAPLGLFLLRLPHGRRLLLAALLFGLPIVFNTGTRFLIPAAPCLALAIAMAVADTKFAVPALMIVHGGGFMAGCRGYLLRPLCAAHRRVSHPGCSQF